MLAAILALAVATARAATVYNATDVQGSSFASPLANQNIAVAGIVTAKGPSGFWIQSGPTDDVRVSSGLHIYSTSANVRNAVQVGDLVSVNGKVQEFRSQAQYLTLTELGSPTNITVLSSGHTVDPVVLGVDRNPPTSLYTSLDVGPGGFLATPNNVSQLQVVNLALEPEKFGLDFWESLEGMLVTIRKPVALNFENQYGEFWVRGDYPVTGLNARGGLTMTGNPDGSPDMNPEAVIIGSPLDGTKNPITFMGAELSDITGVVEYTFGFYSILPLTKPTLLNTANTTAPVAELERSEDACVLFAGDYNTENMSVNSSHLPAAADHIVNSLKGPEIVFLQEIQDDNGPTDTGSTSANGTLQKLVDTIASVSGGALKYSFVDVAPENNKDGGQPGGNIRVAYAWLADRVTLVPGTVGGALDANEVTTDADGQLNLKFNPGRIEPASDVWDASRKPIVAVWEKVGAPAGSRFFTVNVHFTSKGGSSSDQGDARPPVNGGIEQREGQVTALTNFVKSILAKDKDAAVITSGDWNEFVYAPSVYGQLDGVLVDIDEAAHVPPVERYTYAFNANSEQLDHIFVSPALAARGPKVDHVHVNTHSVSFKARISDHDPSVFHVNICKSVTPPTDPEEPEEPEEPQPEPDCTYKIGTYCAPPLPEFTDAKGCL
ncbi:DNase I-like protein [Auricularia subglabra TFB-10046 SS5]|nr:DNase I-like protein [Auricularia subglabra TFB-10046 SS5]